jgi:hypothetical protein
MFELQYSSFSYRHPRPGETIREQVFRVEPFHTKRGALAYAKALVWAARKKHQDACVMGTISIRHQSSQGETLLVLHCGF